VRVFWALSAIVFGAILHGPDALAAQRGAGGRPATIEVDPPQLTLEVGESASLRVAVRGADGEILTSPVIFLAPGAARSLAVDPEGRVEAFAPGQFRVTVRVPSGGRGGGLLAANVTVRVPFPPLDRVEVVGLSATLYSGTFLQPDYRLYDIRDALREDAITFSTTDASVVGVDRYGQLTPKTPGLAVLRMEADGLVEEIPLRVEENPARSVELVADAAGVRTGDVVRLTGVVRDAMGRALSGIPVHYSLQTAPNRADRAAPASGQVTADGRFVAERAGRYTITASVGTSFATSTIDVVPRDVRMELTVLGRGPVRDDHSSDLWVWSGQDGRDYALTGTWGAGGAAYVWDVTDPENIRRIDEVRVDARTVNDVKVSEDGRVAVITREGASDRRNGVVLLDVSDPFDVREIVSYDEGLTGGVHNAFIHRGHLYAVNNGTRYDVLDIREPSNPFRVASFALDTPGTSIHDVWVEDGIAYSSNWEDGVVLVAVGHRIAGGAPHPPREFASYRDALGQTHAAFPFRSQSTGRFYVILGDESFPNGLDPQGPTVPAGYMHVVDFTDFDHPVEVARFEVPEAGSHNMWVEDDILYAAFYNGGLRVVDLSGELMGDLYRQGREIAHFVPKDQMGVVPNEAMVWGAQPHKGVVFLSDWNSGLWAVRLDSPVED
jgi:hypothetical protein